MRTTTAILNPQFERPVSGADLVAFQRLVRRVPVAEPVMRYALELVRMTAGRRRKTAPDVVKKWVAFGASVRAAQYLILGAQGTRADERPLPRELRRHPRAGASGAAPPRAHELPRRVGRRHQRRRSSTSCWKPCRRRARGCKTAHGTASLPGARFVDPKVLARIGNLELLARTVVDGFINGLHRSPYFGASVDFAEHRGYMPGDDIRRVDWKLFARTDRYYLKEYEADTNTNFSVILDVSRSMGFASHGISKLEYGKYLCACLAYLAQQQRDRVGFVTFDNDIVDAHPAVGQAPRRACCTRSIAPRPSGRAICGAAAEDGRALRPPRHRGDRLGPATRPPRPSSTRSSRCGSAATTSWCSTCSTRPRSISPSAKRRASRTSRPASRFPSCRLPSRRNTSRWCRSTSRR